MCSYCKDVWLNPHTDTTLILFAGLMLEEQAALQKQVNIILVMIRAGRKTEFLSPRKFWHFKICLHSNLGQKVQTSKFCKCHSVLFWMQWNSWTLPKLKCFVFICWNDLKHFIFLSFTQCLMGTVVPVPTLPMGEASWLPYTSHNASESHDRNGAPPSLIPMLHLGNVSSKDPGP